jgi:transcription initiation factor IIF auxiliary subunit
MSETKNEIITKPFIYGSIAMYLGKKGQQNNSYKWCVYVRGVHNENISNFIKEVQFTLHDSFENKVRVIPKWPFELYETGWGEFEIKIKIFLVDETIKPLEVVHPLKLFPQQSHIAPSSKRPVIEENYDEIIFVNPKPHIRELLMKKYDSNLSLNKNDDEKNFDNVDNMNIEEGDDNNSIGDKNGEKNDLMDVDDDKRDGDKSKDDDYDKKNNDGENKNDINSNSKIPNISQYFKEVDDSSNLKDFEEHNLFITNEIENLKNLILEKEKQISDLMKSLKELK